MARQIDIGNLEREQSNLDQAMYVAGCMSGSQGPQLIYCSTNAAIADPETGEKYLIIDEKDTTRHYLRTDEAWQPVYRIQRLVK